MDASDFAEQQPLALEAQRERLIAAAQLVRTWVHAQRRSWSEPADAAAVPSPTAPPPLPSFLAHQPAEGSAVVSEPLPPAVLLPEAPVLAPWPPAVAVEPQVPADSEPVPQAAPAARKRIRPALPPEFFQWAARAAVAAVVAGAVVAISWTAHSYWAKWQAAPRIGTAVLESEPPGDTVLVDGAAAGTTPLKKELPAGRHVVEFHHRNMTRTMPIDVVNGRATTTRIEWTVHRAGKIAIESTPTGAHVLLDGHDRGMTPLTIDDVPVGPHTMVLDAGNGKLQRTITVAEDRVLEINEAIFSGWMHVSSPIELQIREGKSVIRLDDQNQALLTPGTHTVRFENRALSYADSRTIEVKPGEVARVTLAPEPSRLTLTSTLPATVMVDGTPVGDTPLTDVPVDIGTREITVTAASGEVRRRTITVTTQPVNLEIDFGQP